VSLLPENDLGLSTPRFTEALAGLAGKVSNQRRSCLPARVVTFDSTKRTCNCKLLITEENGDELPMLTGVPVQYPTGGGFSVTYPLSEGDEVLLFFADRDFERWLLSGRAGPPQSGRRNTLSDAFAVPGVKDFADSSVSVGAGLRIEHSSSGMRIRISSAGKVAIEKGNVELLNLINSLIEALKVLTVNTTTGLVLPTTVSSLAAVQTSLGVIKE